MRIHDISKVQCVIFHNAFFFNKSIIWIELMLRLTKELYVSHWYKAADDTRFVAPRSQTDTEITSSTQLFLWNGFSFRCAIIKHILV